MNIQFFLQKFGKKISQIRKAKDLNQKEAAEQAGISYRYYQSIETGKANVTMGILYRLAKFFRVQPTELVPPAEEPVPQT